jgi:hypothetical protein
LEFAGHQNGLIANRPIGFITRNAASGSRLQARSRFDFLEGGHAIALGMQIAKCCGMELHSSLARRREHFEPALQCLGGERFAERLSEFSVSRGFPGYLFEYQLHAWFGDSKLLYARSNRGLDINILDFFLRRGSCSAHLDEIRDALDEG